MRGFESATQWSEVLWTTATVIEKVIPSSLSSLSSNMDTIPTSSVYMGGLMNLFQPLVIAVLSPLTEKEINVSLIN